MGICGGYSGEDDLLLDSEWWLEYLQSCSQAQCAAQKFNTCPWRETKAPTLRTQLCAIRSSKRVLDVTLKFILSASLYGEQNVKKSLVYMKLAGKISRDNSLHKLVVYVFIP